MTTFSDSPWDGAASNYDSTEAYCAACLIDENEPGAKKVQALCKLPYKEAKGGAVNLNALRSIASVLAGGMGGVKGVAPAIRKAAAAKLDALQRQAKMGKYAQGK